MEENKEKLEQLKPKVVKFGFLEKEGGIYKNWGTRYFVLFSDGELEYYSGVNKPKDENQIAEIKSGNFKGSINISFVRFKTSKVNTNNLKKRVTKRRNLFLKLN
jgi:hypothetical protein